MKKTLRGMLAVAVLAICMAGTAVIPAKAAESKTAKGNQSIVESVQEQEISETAELAKAKKKVKSGWVKTSSGKKYYKKGKAIKGWKVIKGKKYYFSKKNAVAVTGKRKIGNGIYYFDKNGVMQKKVWKVIKGKKYFFGYNGRAKTGFSTINGKRYYFDKNGVLQKSIFFQINGNTYFVGYKGHTFSGLKRVKGTYYYFTSNGSVVKNEWKTINGKIFYFAGSGRALSGFATIGDHLYYFNKNGVLQRNKFIGYNGNLFYMTDGGYVEKGLKQINGKYYYFAQYGKAVRNDWVTIGDNKYYFGDNWAACTGLKEIGGKRYIFYADGKLANGKGLVTIDGNTYYCDSTGQPQTGYKNINGSYYYFGSDGIMYRKKWAYVDGYKFYFCSNGKRAVEVDDVLGKQDSYEIIVNKYSNIVTVYAKDGDNGYIIPVRSFICSTGQSTPLGTFHTQSHYRWHELMGPCWGQWCTGIYEGYLFHSVYYNDVNNNNALSVYAYNKLGTTCSHGCVRLTAGDAKWLFDNCEVGTKVTIINEKGRDPFPKPTAYQLPSWHTWDPTDPNMQYKCRKNGCH